MGIIFHITTKSEFEKAKSSGSYMSPSLEKEGFIHCSQHYQVCEVADFIFKNKKDLVLLAIDEEKCQREIKYEGPSWNTFPHIYGSLNFDSVVKTFDFPETSTGFKLPSEALNLVIETLTKKSNGPLYKESRHYDAMNGAAGTDVNFYIQQARQKNGSVLDLACGSGRFSIPIAKAGLSVSGLDLSITMLELAKEKAKKENIKIDFRLGDIRLFNFDKKFDFIFCGFNSSQHLHEEKEYRSFLECVRSHLNPNGIFAFDIFNPSISMLNRKPADKFLVSKYNDPDDGREIEVWEYPSYDSAKQLSSFVFHYVKNGDVLFEEKFSVRNYFPLEIDLILKNSKFDVVKKLGGFKDEPFSGNSMKQVFICHTF
jgi:uncharacterized protein (DUF952 family)/ubiquinone/menaquinone biosynthesis C-methylase UbiE